jgi:hypothetical protein
MALFAFGVAMAEICQVALAQYVDLAWNLRTTTAYTNGPTR